GLRCLRVLPPFETSAASAPACFCLIEEPQERFRYKSADQVWDSSQVILYGTGFVPDDKHPSPHRIEIEERGNHGKADARDHTGDDFRRSAQHMNSQLDRMGNERHQNDGDEIRGPGWLSLPEGLRNRAVESR